MKASRIVFLGERALEFLVFEQVMKGYGYNVHLAASDEELIQLVGSRSDTVIIISASHGREDLAALLERIAAARAKTEMVVFLFGEQGQSDPGMPGVRFIPFEHHLAGVFEEIQKLTSDP